MRIKNLEFRQLGGDRLAEIICWSHNGGKSEFCYTVLWFKKDNEGYYIEFVGDRPLKVEDRDTLWNLMEYGQTVLDAQWRLHERSMDNQ